MLQLSNKAFENGHYNNRVRLHENERYPSNLNNQIILAGSCSLGEIVNGRCREGFPFVYIIQPVAKMNIAHALKCQQKFPFVSHSASIQ